MSNIEPRRGPGRPTQLDKVPGLIELVAELYASGRTQAQMLEHLPISGKDTLRSWLKDERVLLKVEEIMREKSLRIRRKVDGEIEKRLGDPNRIRNMPPETLLKIRREMSMDFPEKAPGAEVATVIEKLMRASYENPELAQLINDLNIDVPGLPAADMDSTAEEIPDELPDPDEPPIDVEAVLAQIDDADDTAAEEGHEGLPL